MTRAFVFLCSSIAILAQAPSFEAASIKPADPSAPGRGYVMDRGDRLTHTNTNVHNELARAYLVKGYQVAGPSWISSERFDIVAKAPDNSPKEQIPRMLQTLLTERFKLVLHREQREMPVYLLTATKGSKLQDTRDGAIGYDLSNGHRILKNHTIAQFADFLSGIVQRPVLDRTEMPGTYNFPLEMSLEELGGINAKPESSAPSIFTIVESLGLKLESRKASIEVIVVDSGNKIPTEN